MTAKRKFQERIKGCNELIEMFPKNEVVVKAIEKAKKFYQVQLDEEILLKTKKAKVAAKNKLHDLYFKDCKK